jgi:hypothetical protein
MLSIPEAAVFARSLSTTRLTANCGGVPRRERRSALLAFSDRRLDRRAVILSARFTTADLVWLIGRKGRATPDAHPTSQERQLIRSVSPHPHAMHLADAPIPLVNELVATLQLADQEGNVISAALLPICPVPFAPRFGVPTHGAHPCRCCTHGTSCRIASTTIARPAVPARGDATSSRTHADSACRACARLHHGIQGSVHCS